MIDRISASAFAAASGESGASRGAVTLVRPAFVADIYGPERYGTIAGAPAAFVMTATVLAPVSAGAAYDLVGDYRDRFCGRSASSRDSRRP